MTMNKTHNLYKFLTKLKTKSHHPGAPLTRGRCFSLEMSGREEIFGFNFLYIPIDTPTILLS